ncbi:chromatin modification-related protein eaf-1-like isoform X2 [Anopheles albimanus]|uniref:chromatin modification-related protein eaf-1-like isoform X2 n=1 Tax=Anopheles albimanus TaxID=7167 RepID=UPI00163F84E4|nr:chromatin modification-related protein eaf-1-like isoform X2 [Anopheles albimanus]
MKSFLVFLLVAVPLVLAADKLTKTAHKSSAMGAAKPADSVASATTVTEFKKIRKPKRSNGEIPLLIIRPVEKRRKIYFKEPTVKIASGGVATYGTYPELHTSDGEMFTLEHMLPILSLEGMLKGFSKHSPVPNHFIPSPQFKPSDIHHIVAPQKTKEEYHLSFGDKTPLKPSQLLSIAPSPHKPTEAIPAQSLPSPPPPNYVPAEKPAFVKPEQLPASFNFKVQEEVSHYKVNAIPLKSPPEAPHQAHLHHYGGGGGGGSGATSYVGSQNEPPKYSKPVYHHHGHEQVQHKKPQLSSVTTNFYHPKTINAEQEQGHQHPSGFSQPQQQGSVQTHLSYYFPKEESIPQSASPQQQQQYQQHQQQQQQQHSHSSQATSYSSVQAGAGTGTGSASATTSSSSSSGSNGEHIEFVVQKQTIHEVPSVAQHGEKPIHKTYSSHIKQKYQKQHHQPHVFIQKYFEFPGGKGGNHKNVVSEYHGTQNDTTEQHHQHQHPAHHHHHHHHLPEPQAYAAPQYLPLPQPQALHQPHPPATLHQSQPHHVHHPVHQMHSGPAQSYWKFGRRNQDIKPVVEHTNEPEQDSQHAGSVAIQVKHTSVTSGTVSGSSSASSSSTTTTTPAVKDSKMQEPKAQDRIDGDVVASGATTNNGTVSNNANQQPTRTPKQIQNNCERRCIRNTVAQANEPVCGTDGQTYTNRGKLRCARTCGKDDLEIRSYGECSPSGKNA